MHTIRKFLPFMVLAVIALFVSACGTVTVPQGVVFAITNTSWKPGMPIEEKYTDVHLPGEELAKEFKDKTGFVQVPIEYVPQGAIWAYKNPEYKSTQPLMEKYTNWKYENTMVYSEWKMDPRFVQLTATRVEQGNVGIQIISNNADGSQTTVTLPPDYYREIPNEFVPNPAVPAAQVTPGNIVLYCSEDDYRFYDIPGQVNIPASQTRSLTRGPVTVRLVPETLKTDAAACQSTLCDGILTKVPVLNSAELAEVSYDIAFHWDLRAVNAQALCELGDETTAIQNQVFKPLRQIRPSFGEYDEVAATTREAWEAMNATTREFMETYNAGVPILFDNIGIRSWVVGTQEYRDARSAELRQIQVLQDKLNEQRMQEQINEFERQQALKDAQNQAAIIDTINTALGKLDWRVALALLDKLEVNFGMNLDGTPTTAEPGQ